MALRVALSSLALCCIVTMLACGLTWLVFPPIAGESADRREILLVCLAVCAGITPVALTPLVGLAFRFRALSARLQRAALTDPLTGIPNRRAFFDHAEAWLAGLEPRRFGLLMIDADRFKELNDRHGHEAGDAALQAIAGRIGAGLAGAGPPEAMLARLGGEEFAVFLGDFGPREAARAAAAVCESVRQSAFHHRGRRIPLTVSIGVWAGVATEVDGPLAEADLAVYRAKSAGRDRWEMAEDVEEGADWPGELEGRSGRVRRPFAWALLP